MVRPVSGSHRLPALMSRPADQLLPVCGTRAGFSPDTEAPGKAEPVVQTAPAATCAAHQEPGKLMCVLGMVKEVVVPLSWLPPDTKVTFGAVKEVPNEPRARRPSITS